MSMQNFTVLSTDWAIYKFESNREISILWREAYVYQLILSKILSKIKLIFDNQSENGKNIKYTFLKVLIYRENGTIPSFSPSKKDLYLFITQHKNSQYTLLFGLFIYFALSL